MIQRRSAAWWLWLLLIPSYGVHAAKTECPTNLTHTTVETSEIEAKFLVPKLEFDPKVERLLFSGEVTPLVPQRGFVHQQYIPPTPQNLRRVFKEMKALGVEFGTETEQAEFLKPGVAQEIRLMSGSIKRRDGRHETRQITIKGAGGVSIAQLESPRDVSRAKVQKIAKLFKELRPLVVGAARKMYFEIAAADSKVTEVDIFLGGSGIGAPPIFINGEVEFHGPSALAEAAAYREAEANRPAYLGVDLTDAPGVKSRHIALDEVPEEIEKLLKPHRQHNHLFADRLMHEFVNWADTDLAEEILYPPVDIDVKMIDPKVFAPNEDEAILKHFKTQGYVVVDHVSRAEDRERLVQLMTRTARHEPRARRLGFMDIYHDDSLVQMRQDFELYRVFQNIFGTEKLWVVFDRVMFWRKEEPDLPLPPHVDQNPVTHPEFFAAQGMLALRDMNEGTGTLVLAPGSHTRFSHYAPWTRQGAGFVELRGKAPWKYKGVRLKAGQIVIWDSRVTHSRYRGTPKDDRFAALLTFAPAKEDEHLRGLRVDRFEKGIGDNNHEAGLRATARPRFERSLRESDEHLTELGRKLYGVTSWFSSP